MGMRLRQGDGLSSPSRATCSSKMADRPFSVALVFGIFWIALAYFADFLIFPVWSNLNISLCVLGIIVCVVNYVIEYLGIFQLPYSKFAPDGDLPARLGWTLSYGTPAVVYIVLWYLSGMPRSSFHTVALVTYVGHFVKRVLEVLLLHKYSKKIRYVAVIEVSTFYTLGSVVQHYWCNIYTSEALAAQLSLNHKAVAVGVGLYIVGELINFYHHMLLAHLRPSGSSSKSYVIPQGGLFSFVVCPHYFGELIAWYGMAVAGQHLCLYLAWLSMVCYLSGRSYQTHLWYRKKIENFPENRRNMFPGIY